MIGTLGEINLPTTGFEKNVILEFYQLGSFLCIDGPAKKAGKKHSEMKVCFTCRDSNLLKTLLEKIVQDEECYWVKMSTKDRDGMFLGRCFFTSSDRAARLWAKYKTHPRFMVTLQDDEFALAYRELVLSWNDKPENSLE